MAIDFPNSPTLNQDYTVGTTTWTYDGAKWVLKTYNSLHAVPVTAMMLWASTTYPTGWLLANGSAISRVTYADLFAAIGTTYGVGDGSTTFNLPSMTSAGTGSPNTIIKVTNSGALEPSAISHASNHTEGGSDVITVTGNQINNYQSFRNLIINGGMSVAQRNTSVASITTGNYYTADRWNVATDGTAGTWTQSVENDAPTGSGLRKSLKMLCTVVRSSLSANDALVFEQKVEGQNIQHLAKGTSSTKSITISFWVKSNVTGTYIVRLRDDANSRHISATYTINASATWEKETITFTGDTGGIINNDNTTGLVVQFWLLAGSTYSSGTLATSWAAVSNANCAVGQVNLAGTVSNYWQVTGVQLEVGSVDTPFEFEPFETTLRKCQRYYWHVTPGQQYGIFALGQAYNTTSAQIMLPNPVAMRVGAALTTTGTSADYRLAASNASDLACTSVPTISRPTPYLSPITFGVASGLTAGNASWAYANNATAYLGFSAEL